MIDYRKAPARAVRTLTDMVQVLNPMDHQIHADREIHGFTTDSRQVKEGFVFVAVPGERVDGHDYVQQAFESGAAACLVSSFDRLKDRDQCVLVENTVEALGFLAAAHRRAMPAKLVAITGSVGKTTTKEMITALFSSVFRTRKSRGNFNSTIGLPMEILNLTEEDEWMIAEMGMSYPGELTVLAAIADPDIALWTSVQAVHLANFDSIEDIARAKAELVQGLAPDSVLVYNADDPWVTRFSEPFPGKKVTYSLHRGNVDVMACVEPFPGWSGTHFVLDAGKLGHAKLFSPLVGRFNVFNAVAACTTALVGEVPVAEFSTALRRIAAAPHRSITIDCPEDGILVDDCYNANPYAVRSVLRSFSALAPAYKRWFILGDMLELGPMEKELHADIGREMAEYGFSRLTFIGPLCRNAYDVARALLPGDVEVEHFENVDQAVAELQAGSPANARIWVKASRGMRLEKLVEKLRRDLGAEEVPHAL